jgi:ATP-dependent Clp protease ATP-binding subunit ClpA
MAGLMQGPSGCGKTEILRGLAMNLGRFLFIANFSRVVNYMGFRSILTGK